MIGNHTIRLAEVPLGGREGAVWHELHGKREEICEALLKPVQPGTQALERQQQLQQRLRRIDIALDRLMSTQH